MRSKHCTGVQLFIHCRVCDQQVLLTSRQRANRHKGESLSQHVPRCSLQVSTKGRVMVYVVKTPLEGLEGVGKLLGGLYPRPLEHAVVVLHCQERNVVRFKCKNNCGIIHSCYRDLITTRVMEHTLKSTGCWGVCCSTRSTKLWTFCLKTPRIPKLHLGERFFL
jgi:hypothetical protein